MMTRPPERLGSTSARKTQRPLGLFGLATTFEALTPSGWVLASLLSFVAAAIMFPTSAFARPEPGRVSLAICEFGNQHVDLAIEIDLKSKKATLEFEGSGGGYPVLQKATKANELFHFDLEYSNPHIVVKVFKTSGVEKDSVAIFDDSGKPEKFDGTCILS